MTGLACWAVSCKKTSTSTLGSAPQKWRFVGRSRSNESAANRVKRRLDYLEVLESLNLGKRPVRDQEYAERCLSC